ncbi:MAG: 2Fe-2S iron-sulfur cluster-binding protein [Gammaproteobacteria bacterium]|nr:2Fe-2S iron-sulfur cluster-binding protein [Gammaproteobacteria bacterium]
MLTHPDELRVRIWRGDAGGGEMAAYRAPRLPNQTVLDVVTWIQRHQAPDLSYRFSCRVGMCGSCAMTVNGAPRWTCRTHVKEVARNRRDGQLELAPLRNLPVVKDLVCDMADFFRKWRQAEGRFRGGRGRFDAVSAVTAADPHRAAADAAIECINCAVCYAACDVVAWNPGYLGPAALNRAWTLVNDARDTAQSRRLRAIADAGGGCQHCHSQHHCAQYCPVQLSPAHSIAGLKRRVGRAVLRGEL